MEDGGGRMVKPSELSAKEFNKWVVVNVFNYEVQSGRYIRKCVEQGFDTEALPGYLVPGPDAEELEMKVFSLIKEVDLYHLATEKAWTGWGGCFLFRNPKTKEDEILTIGRGDTPTEARSRTLADAWQAMKEKA